MEALLYALLLESANDAATAIAIAVAGSTDAFAEKMNERAKTLGLINTHFENPHGLDGAEHYTTAYDLAKLASHALSNETFRKICSTYKMKIPLNTDEGVRVLVNHNKMLHLYEGAVGVKTGFTKKSGRCLVSAAEREGLLLVAVTLNAPDDWDDHKKMLDFGFSRYSRVTYAKAGEYTVSLPVVNGKAESITVSNSDALAATLKKEHGEITCKTEAPQFLYAPVNKGDVVGRVICICNGKEIASSDLIATDRIDTVKQSGFWTWLLSIFKK
ncbi:MAG: D-alanyl-D-alanine carboxypeptidase [Clostridia bacterium]|nr:D-alanyl-D-alanine carboxypeptidase [Clostridia bacterium]